MLNKISFASGIFRNLAVIMAYWDSVIVIEEDAEIYEVVYMEA